MNKQRRKTLTEISNRLRVMRAELENVSGLSDCAYELDTELDGETEYRDNMPENMANSERGGKANEAVDELDSAKTEIENAAEALTGILDGIDNALASIDNATAT